MGLEANLYYKTSALKEVEDSLGKRVRWLT